MTDLRLNDVVETNLLMGTDGLYAKGICKDCSKQHKAEREEFKLDGLKRLNDNGEFVRFVPDEVDKDVLKYVAAMRAWNCCRDGEEPLGGFPEQPDTKRIELGEQQ